MKSQELSAIFDELDELAKKAIFRSVCQKKLALQNQEMEKELRKLRTENSVLKDKNTQLQENQKTWQNRLRGILNKMETNDE